jgi:hypothetical protein
LLSGYVGGAYGRRVATSTCGLGVVGEYWGHSLGSVVSYGAGRMGRGLWGFWGSCSWVCFSAWGAGGRFSVQPGVGASARGGYGVCEGDCSAGRRAGGVGLLLGGPGFFASVQIKWRWARLWGCVWHHGQGAIIRQVVWGTLSFSAVWWRQNLREAFSGVWVAVSTAGVVPPLWTQVSACSHSCRGWRLVSPVVALFALLLAAVFGD